MTILTSTPSLAFFQSTKLEGPIGTDIGGVWLSMQHVMPEFRVSYQKPENGKAVPFTAAAIPDELAPIMGKNAGGVVIAGCDGNFCATNGLVVGDVVNRINSVDITDVASFEKAVENVPPTVLLSIRRPSLRMSSARLFKFKYANEGRETQEGSEAKEDLDIQVLDVKVPFADEIETGRQKHTLYDPTPADLETLKAKWFDLPMNEPILFMSGENRFVARSNFDQALEADKVLTDSKFAMILNMEGNPMRGGGKSIDVYGIESISDTTMEGRYVTVTMTNAPFPINIEFKGRFVMKKLAPWSDQDDKIRSEKSKNKAPKEDLSKFKTLPDVPPPAKPAEQK